VLVSLTAQGRAMEQRCSLGEVLIGASGMKQARLVELNEAVQGLLRSIDSTKEQHGR